MSRLGSRILFTAPVIVGHLLFPLSLLLHLWSASSQDRMTWLAALYVAGSYFSFLYLAGSWSWFGGMMRHILPTFLLVTVWATYLHGNPKTILDFTPSPDFLLSILMGTFFAALTIFSVHGRKGPSKDIELSFPLRGGTFCIVQGGASRVLNHHYVHTSQRYAIDVVKLSDSGIRAQGLYPPTPDRYAIWEAEVVSPCDGRVLEAVDGVTDLLPPVRDPGHPAGNHLVIESDRGTVYLAHLRQGSICVRVGERVRTGQMLGRVGNSGNTTEPHLHLHAEEGPYSGTFSGRPGLPIRFDGRFLVRNDMIRVRAGVAVKTPEAEASRAVSPELPVVGDSAIRTHLRGAHGPSVSHRLRAMKPILALFMCLCFLPGNASSQPAPPDTTISFHQDLAWSPDGQWIVFSVDVGSGYDLWLAPVAGDPMKAITHDGKSNLWASWSPDGQKLAFTSGRDGGTDIYVMDAQGQTVRRLTQGAGRNQAPSWSPDQSHIVFTSDRTGRWQIFVMASDGTDPEQITQDTTLVHNPLWSPQGSKIVFYAGPGKGNDQIFTVDPEGKHRARLTQDEKNNIYPSWSLDGKRILFCSNRDGTNALYSMKADGSNVEKVIDRLAFFGRWSPDGKWIAAIFGRYPHTAIGIMHQDGKEPVWITPRLKQP